MIFVETNLLWFSLAAIVFGLGGIFVYAWKRGHETLLLFFDTLLVIAWFLWFCCAYLMLIGTQAARTGDDAWATGLTVGKVTAVLLVISFAYAIWCWRDRRKHP